MITSQRRAASATNGEARDKLLEATARLISGEGLSSVTSRSIARESGENLGSITYYFGSKDALISEALAFSARRLINPVLDRLSDPDVDPVLRMLAAVQMLVELLANNTDQLPAYAQSLATAATRPGQGAEVQRLHSDLRKLLAVGIEAQVAAGQLPNWIRADQMASLIVSLVNGVALSVAIQPDEVDVPAVATQFGQLLIAARN